MKLKRQKIGDWKFKDDKELVRVLNRLIDYYNAVEEPEALRGIILDLAWLAPLNLLEHDLGIEPAPVPGKDTP